MNPVTVRNVRIGEGIPKICVPIVGKTRTKIREAGENIRDIGADIIEWRADWYEDVFLPERVEETAKELREVLGDMPLLFTFRTAKEGGVRQIGKDAYVRLNQNMARTGYIDMADVEMFTGEDAVREVIRTAHAFEVKVVVSNHDFHGTPSKEEMVARLRRMQEMGADIPKIAVMPRDKKDVLALLAATEEMYSEYADRPVITMSMDKTGVVSRLCGEVFGSAVTFGSAGKASAPGQVETEELRRVLKLLHGIIEG